MDQTQVTEKKGNRKIIIIALLVLVLVTSASLTYFLASSGMLAGVVEKFRTEEELVLKLEEFTVNLKSESNSFSKHYLKTKMAIMYTDSKQTEKLQSYESKIRDIINGELRSKSYEQILDYGNTATLKSEIKDKINESLNEEMVKEVYITDIIIQ